MASATLQQEGLDFSSHIGVAVMDTPIVETNRLVY